MLGLPYAFKRVSCLLKEASNKSFLPLQAGLMEGVLVMVFVSYFAIKAMLLIIDCKYKVGQTDQLQTFNLSLTRS